MTDTQTTALVLNDPEWDAVSMVERRRWRVAMCTGSRTFKDSRRAAVEWCEEMNVAFTVVADLTSIHRQILRNARDGQDLRFGIGGACPDTEVDAAVFLLAMQGLLTVTRALTPLGSAVIAHCWA